MQQCSLFFHESPAPSQSRDFTYKKSVSNDKLDSDRLLGDEQDQTEAH